MVRRGGGPGGGALLAAVLAAALLPILALPARAEVSASVTLSAYGTVARYGDGAAAGAFLKSRLDLQSTGNENVRGQLQLDGWVGDGLYLDIPRAWIRVRFPHLRLTAGRSRLSWGEGFVFNAGDVIFGSLDLLSGDISAAALRDETAWLTALYVPLGPFSFLEAVVLPFGARPSEAGGLSDTLAGLLNPLPLGELAGGAGLRGVFRLGGLKLEPGWYADWAEREHRPYLSLQGHFLADWHLSAVLAVPLTEPEWSRAGDWLALSGGLFHLTRLGGGRSLALRLEAVIRPGARWQAAEGDEALPAGHPDAPVYGLALFPEAAVALSDTLSLQLRALVSPVDLSGLGLLAVSWNVYQGLRLFANVAAMAGDGDDLYGWRQGGPALTLGAEFIY